MSTQFRATIGLNRIVSYIRVGNNAGGEELFCAVSPHCNWAAAVVFSAYLVQIWNVGIGFS